MNILSDLSLKLLGSAIFSILVLIFFKGDVFKAYLFDKFGLKFSNTITIIRSRRRLIELFNKIFVSYSLKKGGHILLMSHAGGYPEFDPYSRLLELAAHGNLIIYIATSTESMRAYCKDHPDTTKRLIEKANVHVYLFDDFTPYHYRIGINTDIGLGFFCNFYGHKNDRVDLEGIVSSNPRLIEALKGLYMGLLAGGKEIRSHNFSLIAPRLITTNLHSIAFWLSCNFNCTH